MPPPEQRVDALIEASKRYQSSLEGASNPSEIGDAKIDLDAARAALLAAMGGDAVAVAWQYRRIGQPWPIDTYWRYSLSLNFDVGHDPAIYEQRALFDHPPIIAEWMREAAKELCEAITAERHSRGITMETHKALAKMQRALRAPPTPSAIAEGMRWRHKKRGSTYVEVGRAELQCNKLRGFSEGDTIVVYRCEADGKLWARPADEFEDGRFEPLPPAPGEGPAPDDGHHFPNL